MLHTSCVAVASKYNKYSVGPPAARATLRQFALTVHEAEGVADACVKLQDRFGLDVNVLLMSAYVGAVLRRPVTAQDVGAARALVEDWHRDVVRPLRGVRRLLKSGPTPAPNAQIESVRQQVAKAELDAELVELDVLGGWTDDLGDAPEVTAPDELARAAMEVAIQSYSPLPIDDDERYALALISDVAARVGGQSS